MASMVKASLVLTVCCAVGGIAAAPSARANDDESAYIAEATADMAPETEEASAEGEADGVVTPTPRRKANPAVEEIRVTARRREELLQKTPISITAFSDADLEAAGADNISDISLATPNLEFDAAAGGTNTARIFIRGVGQGDPIMTADAGVGLYVDGLSVTRSAGGIFGLLDVERVEVLRGPQGALYGKSTIGGAINVITKKPNGEGGGTVYGAYGHDRRSDFRASYDFPLLRDKLFARVSYRTSNSDGFARDTFNNEDLGGVNQDAARLALRWLPTETQSLDFTFERTYTRDDSIAFKIREVDPTSPFINVSEDVGAPFALGLDIADPFAIANDNSSRNDLDIMAGSLTWTMEDLPGNTTVTWINGMRFLEQKLNLDVDGTQFTGIGQVMDDENRSFSSELRVQGLIFDDRLEWTAGLFYFREDGRSQIRADLFNDASAAIVGVRTFLTGLSTCPIAGAILGQVPNVDGLAAVLQDVNATEDQQTAAVDELADFFGRIASLGGAGGGGAGGGGTAALAAACGLQAPRLSLGGNGGGVVNDPTLTPEQIEARREQGRQALAAGTLAIPDETIVSTNNKIENQNYAAYLALDYSLTDSIQLELAGRYNYERKDLFRNQVLIPSMTPVIDRANVDVGFRDFSPSFSISYDPGPNLFYFFRVAQGFKSGGFNGRAQRIRVGGVSSEEARGLLEPFDPERITSFEAGVKSDWFDRQLTANLTLFYNLYEDIQQARLTTDESGQLTSLIDNAAKAIVQGAEVEIDARPWSDFTISATGGLTYGRFTSFPGALSNPNFNPNDPTTGPASFDGEDFNLANTPLFTGSLSATQRLDLPGNLGSLSLRADYDFRTRAFNNVTNTARTKTPKRGLINGRIAWQPLFCNDCEIAIVGRNLLDREYVQNGVDLLDAFGFASAQFGRPREVFVEARYRFE